METSVGIASGTTANAYPSHSVAPATVAKPAARETFFAVGLVVRAPSAPLTQWTLVHIQTTTAVKLNPIAVGMKVATREVYHAPISPMKMKMTRARNLELDLFVVTRAIGKAMVVTRSGCLVINTQTRTVAKLVAARLVEIANGMTTVALA